MNALQIPTTAAGTMRLVQIPRDRSTALVVLDSPAMDTTVKVTKIIKAWCPAFEHVLRKSKSIQ